MRYSKRGPFVPFVLLLFVFLLQSCANNKTYRYSQRVDSAPTFTYKEIDYIEPTPIFEQYNVRNSRPYKVMGRYYTPLHTGKGFVQYGYASWYGQKFHGHKTANGEVFDMFELTAAHPTLPLPSFARVTNLENGKVTTVRINDRGPFHGSRIIDLSYAAAKKLDFKDKGTSKVKVEVIYVDKNGHVSVGKEPSAPTKTLTAKRETSTPTNSSVRTLANATAVISRETAKEKTESAKALFVQVMALSDTRRAQNLAKGLSDLLQLPTQLPKSDEIYRLQIGPLESEQKAQKVIKDLANIGFNSAFSVSTSLN